MKRRTKRILILVTIAIAIWVTSVFVDYYNTIHNFEKPIFAKLDNNTAKDDGGSGTYIGVGYSIDITGNFMPDDVCGGVTYSTFSLFGIDIKDSIRD